MRQEFDKSFKPHDRNGNELFENDIIQMYDSYYKVTYFNDAWHAEFIGRIKPLGVNEFPRCQYVGVELWSKIAVLIRREA